MYSKNRHTLVHSYLSDHTDGIICVLNGEGGWLRRDGQLQRCVYSTHSCITAFTSAAIRTMDQRQSIIHRNAPSAEPGGKHRLCGAKRVRRVESESAREGRTGDTLIIRGVYSRTFIFWFNQEEIAITLIECPSIHYSRLLQYNASHSCFLSQKPRRYWEMSERNPPF